MIFLGRVDFFSLGWLMRSLQRFTVCGWILAFGLGLSVPLYLEKQNDHLQSNDVPV